MYFNKISDITSSSLEELCDNNGYFLVFIAEKSAHEADEFISLCNLHGIKIAGGIYPTIIHGTRNFEEGILVIKVPTVERVLKFSLDDETTFENIKPHDEIRTALLLTDGLMTQTDNFLRRIYSIFGNQMNIVGGGAGFMTLKQQPCVFTNEGLFQNGAVMLLFKTESKIGVKHGWKVFAGPFIATSTHKNVIKELNWRPAFEVYKEVIEANSSNRFTENNFLEIAKIFPFGIYKEGTELIVRDPVILNGDEITCLSDVPENSMLQILTGDPDTLILAAKNVAEMTIHDDDTLSNCVMVFDCITRVMYLDNRFEDELKAMEGVYQNKDCRIRGVATLGEIASSGMGFVEFYNKTIVVSSLFS